jgi:hypothetical protein
MMLMEDTVAHMQITAETIYDSAQRNRRLAHELLYLGRSRSTTKVLCSFGAMVKLKTIVTKLGMGRGRVGSVDYRAKSDQMGMAGL